VSANPNNDKATDNYPTVRVSGPVEIILIWNLLKTIAKRILSLLPRRLIQEKEQVLPHAKAIPGSSIWSSTFST
jgi:hypothetical protein